jgi:hypothetical protein
MFGGNGLSLGTNGLEDGRNYKIDENLCLLIEDAQGRPQWSGFTGTIAVWPMGVLHPAPHPWPGALLSFDGGQMTMGGPARNQEETPYSVETTAQEVIEIETVSVFEVVSGEAATGRTRSSRAGRSPKG